MTLHQLKRPWPEGRTHLVLEPVAFLRRLVGIIEKDPEKCGNGVVIGESRRQSTKRDGVGLGG
jgi:hypothetical protein